MDRHYTVKDTLNENRVFLSRVVAVFTLIVLLSLGLVARLVYLQIVGHEHYATLAKENSIKIEPLPPTRGIIYDRKGRILAENLPSYSLELVPEEIEDLNDTIIRLQQLLAIPDEKVEQFHKLRKRRKSFTSTPILLRMSDEDVAKFAAVRPYFPGVDIHARLVRFYPYGELTSHVVGYVGRINERELKTLPEANYRGTHHVGKVGIEKTYEEYLHGNTGYAEIEINAQARAINSIDAVNPIPGYDVYLSLDIELQKTAYDALEQFNGAVVAMEIPRGNVLTFVSKPGFDPNPFVYGITHADYQALQESDDQPLFNRALRGQYPPGSTIKPFVGLAGLEYRATDFNHKLYCPGFYQLPNVSHRYRDWKKWGHGMVDLDDAITQSCDVYFYDLAAALGIDRLHDFLVQFGFGKKTGIDLVGEQAGLMPSREWKKKRFNQSWYPGETLITGIGQGFSQVTPVQLAMATATLASQGEVLTPFLVEKLENGSEELRINQVKHKSLQLHPRHVHDIVTAMIDVVHGERGTARRIGKGIDYLIAGKTGTAQVFSLKQEEKYNEDEIEFKLRDHALFIAFAPAREPRIAIAVIVENGGHGGSVAAPIAAKIISQYLASMPKESHEN